MPDHVQVTLGQFTNRYVLLGPLARGGSATVFVADDLRDHRQVAVKVATAGGWDPRRWKRELATMERLRQLRLPGMLLADDAGRHEGLPYFVMPLCLGGSLQDRVSDSGPISPAAALDILRRLAPMLDRVHAAGLVHRDVKPANILFAEADARVWEPLLSDGASPSSPTTRR